MMVATNGSVRGIDIVVSLRDDGLVEGEETLRVTLQPSDGFELGSARQHIVKIQDNDANWQVVHNVDGMQFDYGMQIIRDGDKTVATMLSDGRNGLPAGIYPINLIGADDKDFEASVGPITMTDDRTLFGTEIASG